MKTDLEGKVVLITGASGGIGSAIARAFAEEGARLVLHYRGNQTGAQRLRRQFPASDTLLAQADLTSEAQTRRLFAAAIKKFSRVDTLVANAGSWETRDVPFQNMRLAQWRGTVDSVLTSTFLSAREFFRIVARQRRGNAVLIGSTAALFGEAGHADYASAKSALAFGLTRTLKNEIARLAPHTRHYCGGRLNCVCPGWTRVPRTEPTLGNAAIVKKITATMALPQVARPEDIAHLVVFLSSDTLARHVTGQTMWVAGGMEGRQLWRPDEIDANLV